MKTKSASFEGKELLKEADKSALKIIIEKKVLERVQWIDNAIYALLPKWKAYILKRLPSRFIGNILGANFTIRTTQETNGDTLIEILQDGKVKDLRVFTVV